MRPESPYWTTRRARKEQGADVEEVELGASKKMLQHWVRERKKSAWVF